MNILITGGCGFIGTNLVQSLLASTNKHNVTNVDKLTYAAHPKSLAEYAARSDYSFIQADIANPELMGDIVFRSAPEAIIHLAAESHVDRSIDDPRTFVDTNVIGTFNLLQSSLSYFRTLDRTQQSSFRLLHVSTDEVFGTLGESGKFTEQSPYCPSSPYAATKAAADHLIRAWGRTYGLPIIVTNCSNNFGPYQFPEKLIPLVILKCIREEPLPIYGNGENVRDWLFVSDHIDALLAVLNRGTLGETYNIGCNTELSNLQLVRLLCQIMDELHPRRTGKHADLIAFVEDRPGHDFRYAIDASKICQELAWRPSHTLADGLRTTVHWYLEHESWWREILEKRYLLERLGKVKTSEGASL